MKNVIITIAVSLGIAGSFGILRAMHNGQPQDDRLRSEDTKHHPASHHQASLSKNSQGEQPPATFHQGSNHVQAIEGRVVDSRGNPAEAIDVIAVRSPKGILLTSKTDKDGYFSIKELSAGNYKVYTQDKDGPTCPLCPFYSGGLPTPSAATVSVHEGQLASNIVLQAPPRLAKLTGRVLDAETNQPILASRITLRRTDPDIYYELGLDENGHFDISVPLVPFTIEVVSPQHFRWNYVRADLPRVLTRVDSLKLNRGEIRKLEVRLKRQPD
jgi:hypothetical protein